MMSSFEDIWLIGSYLNGFSRSDKDLPSHCDVFRRYMYLLKVDKFAKNQCAMTIVNELCAFWRRKGLKYFLNKESIKRKVIIMYNNWHKLKKNSNRETNKDLNNRREFVNLLYTLFDISVKGKSSKKSDKKARDYLAGQINKGSAHAETEAMENDPDSYFEEETDLHDEEQGANESDKNLQLPKLPLLTPADFGSSTDSPKRSSQSDLNFSPDQLNKTPKASSSVKESVKRPRNIINFEIASAFDRCKISDRNAVYLIASIANALEFDVSSLAINRESIRKARQEIRLKFAQEIKNTFNPDVKLTIHWDSKLLPNILPGSSMPKSDRLAIVVSGDGVRKLLATPVIERSTGKAQANAVHDALLDWGIEDR